MTLSLERRLVKAGEKRRKAEQQRLDTSYELHQIVREASEAGWTKVLIAEVSGMTRQTIHTILTEYVGLAEVMEILGVSRQRADQLVRKPGFPRPVAELKAGRIWKRADVEKWHKARGVS